MALDKACRCEQDEISSRFGEAAAADHLRSNLVFGCRHLYRS